MVDCGLRWWCGRVVDVSKVQVLDVARGREKSRAGSVQTEVILGRRVRRWVARLRGLCTCAFGQCVLHVVTGEE
jgi:hypothetical protein